MWLANRYNHKTISAYNETVSRGTGGLEEITKGESVSLNVLIVPITKNIRYLDSGKFIEEKITFQISREELSEKRDEEDELIREEFSFNVGITHVIYGGNEYRVASIMDAEWMNMAQLYQILCVRKIPVRDFV